jgi:OOP family OmpA-OmpF porin
MNKQRVTWALMTALGLAPFGSALAQDSSEGFYLSAFGGAGTIDISKNDLDAAFLANMEGAAASLPIASEVGESFSSLDDSSDVWGADVGYRFNKWVALEVGYINLGEAFYDAESSINEAGVPTNVLIGIDDHVRYSSHGPRISVLGMFAIGERFDIHARGGLYRADTRIREKAIATDPVTLEQEQFFHAEEKASSNDFFVGAGATWNINSNISIRAEYQKFLDVGDEDHGGESDVDVFTFGVLFR